MPSKQCRWICEKGEKDSVLKQAGCLLTDPPAPMQNYGVNVVNMFVDRYPKDSKNRKCVNYFSTYGDGSKKTCSDIITT